MKKMKALYNTFILLSLGLIFFTCKKNMKDDDTDVKPKKEHSKEIIKPKEITQNNEQTIEQYLKQLQLAVKGENTSIIEKSLRFPFRYNSGGELEIYENSSRLKVHPHFKKIVEAKFEKIESDSLYSILYSNPDNEDFFIYYYAIKKNDTFKLIKMEVPF